MLKTTRSVALLCASAAAQVTSPAGLAAVEGNQVFFHFGTSRRFQQVDFTQAGAPLTINSISWRRNGNVAQTAPARVMDFSIDLGHTNFGQLSNRFDDNFTVSRTNVFSGTGLNFPSWATNVGAPAPFDFTVPLPSPFVYNGRDALVIDFTNTNSTVTATIQADRDFTGLTSLTLGTALGTGCIATGRTVAFAHTAAFHDQTALPTPSYGIRMRIGGTNAPASSPVFLFIDAQNQNLPGLCSTLYALPLVLIVMQSQADGSIPDVNFMFMHDASLVGGTFFTQLLAPDPGQAGVPAVVSNGRQTTLAAGTITNLHRCSYAFYAVPSTTGVGTHFVGGGMVMLLQ